MRLKSAWIVLALVAFGSCAGQEVVTEPEEEGSTERTEPKSAQIGQALTLDGQEEGTTVRVTAVRVADPATPKDAGFGGPTDANARFVSIELKMENTGEKVYNDSPTNGGKLIDTADQSYSTTIAEVSEGPAFAGETVTIQPGDTRSGWITWEIPKGATLRTFQYALDSGFGPQTGEWSIG